MDFYADEDFALPVVVELRRLGHDIVTIQEEGRHGSDDLVVLAEAHNMNRAVLTHNRRHFERLHRDGHQHSGIVSCTRDGDFLALAVRIHRTASLLRIGRWCLRINRPP